VRRENRGFRLGLKKKKVAVTLNGRTDISSILNTLLQGGCCVTLLLLAASSWR
jgi:hypothetical protein